MKPCPFCGETPAEDSVEWADDYTVFVECDGCMADGPAVTAGCGGVDEELDDEAMEKLAIDRWDNREP